MFIERYIKKEVLYSLRNNPVTCILGPRQSGKTTFVKNIIKDIKKKVTYLDLELDADRQKMKDPELFLGHRENECVVIDEVQRIPDIFPQLRGLVDRKRIPARFLITGSADPSLIKFTSESLAGRISYIKLLPFNLIEVPKENNLIKHWIRGGFPLSFLAKSDDLSIKWLESFISTYIERDLRILGLDVQSALMRRLWKMISNYHGQMLEMTSISNSLDISFQTLRKYIDFLEGAFIINRLYPYYVNIGKRLIKTPKIFIRDSGILHRLISINNYDELQTYPKIGQSWEGYVIEQIKQIIDEIFNLSMYYYRTHDGSEIDLVIVKGIKPVSCIEIKYSSAPSLSKGNSIAIKDLETDNNFIIIPECDEEYPIRKDIMVCNLETFLEKYLPKM